MMFVTAAFVLAVFCFLFGGLAAWAGNKSGGFARSILFVYAATFIFLSLFSVLAGVGFSVELTNQAPCENIVSSTNTTNNITAYTYVDSCAGRSVPATIERLYQAFATIILVIILVSVLALMFFGLRSVLIKW